MSQQSMLFGGTVYEALVLNTALYDITDKAEIRACVHCCVVVLMQAICRRRAAMTNSAIRGGLVKVHAFTPAVESIMQLMDTVRRTFSASSLAFHRLIRSNCCQLPAKIRFIFLLPFRGN